MIAWNDSLATGFEDIDLQHKTLIKLINGLERAVQEGTAQNRQQVFDLLLFLGGYAKNHLAREERCMARTKCQAAERNKAAHEGFLRDFAQLEERFSNEGSSSELLMAIYHMASQWITGHICTVDIQLRSFAPQPNTSARSPENPSQPPR